jgi:hypothetical protein
MAMISSASGVIATNDSVVGFPTDAYCATVVDAHRDHTLRNGADVSST